MTFQISCVHLNLKTNARFFFNAQGHCVRFYITSTFQGHPWGGMWRLKSSQASPPKTYTWIPCWARGQEFIHRCQMYIAGTLKTNLRPDLAPESPPYAFWFRGWQTLLFPWNRPSLRDHNPSHLLPHWDQASTGVPLFSSLSLIKIPPEEGNRLIPLHIG